MFAFKIRVPRIIYINSKNETKDPEFKKVTGKKLPRDRQVYNLYEWEKSEEVYQEKFHSIQYHHLLNPNVEGIYETKTPLKFRAINELGCLIKPKKSKIPRHEQALGRIYSLDELEVLSGHNSPYLPTGSYERIYMLHSYTG